MKKINFTIEKEICLIYNCHINTNEIGESKMKKKFLLPIIIGILILLPNTSNAVLQANGNTGAAYSLNDWMSNIRKMENLGGAMGLSEELNDNLTSKTSNNIDVHMEKNTEYGALVILSASAYGNPSVINDGETTTGNSTGVVMKINRERVAAAMPGSQAVTFQNAANRYKDVYSTTTEFKIGDAILETTGWHSSLASDWFGDPGKSTVTRSVDGSVFSYDAFSGWNGVSSASFQHGYRSRAVVVCGQGL